MFVSRTRPCRLRLKATNLMSKHRVLSLKPPLPLEWRGQDGQNETEQPEHSASSGDSITSSTQIGFSVHTGACMPDSQAKTLSPRAAARPRCPKCQSRTEVQHIAAARTGFEHWTLRCTRCSLIHEAQISADPVAGFFRLDPDCAALIRATACYSLLTVARVLPRGSPADSQGRKGVIPHPTLAAMHVGS